MVSVNIYAVYTGCVCGLFAERNVRNCWSSVTDGIHFWIVGRCSSDSASEFVWHLRNRLHELGLVSTDQQVLCHCFAVQGLPVERYGIRTEMVFHLPDLSSAVIWSEIARNKLANHMSPATRIDIVRYDDTKLTLRVVRNLWCKLAKLFGVRILFLLSSALASPGFQSRGKFDLRYCRLSDYLNALSALELQLSAPCLPPSQT